ncbi:unnamed protein product [Pleuronectes platessa]|uniref:Uncharacterized protein n=1 Tax=Pleuronectes platessa TaxID=8262 RepID=A0A9N7VLJ6_PLEPL|nr:unnamed protein product [Pleuronectes platessa]
MSQPAIDLHPTSPSFLKSSKKLLQTNYVIICTGTVRLKIFRQDLENITAQKQHWCVTNDVPMLLTPAGWSEGNTPMKINVAVAGQRRMMGKLCSLIDNQSHPLQDTITALGSSLRPNYRRSYTFLRRAESNKYVCAVMDWGPDQGAPRPSPNLRWDWLQPACDPQMISGTDKGVMDEWMDRGMDNKL